MIYDCRKSVCFSGLIFLLLLLPPYPLPFRLLIWLMCLSGLRILWQQPKLMLSRYFSGNNPAGKNTALCDAWFFTGLLFLIGMLAFLEVRQPFYFTQDDNHSQFLPVILNALDGFFATGTFPTWNAYQGLGMTLGGVYNLTYPPLYLSYGLSTLLGNTLYTLEVFAWLHMLAGFCLSYIVLRRMHVLPSLAMASALTLALYGYALITGRSWYIILPVTMYLPGLLYSLWWFYANDRLNKRWIFLTAINHGLWFHSGHAQLWFYGMSLWGVGMLWILWMKGVHRTYNMQLLSVAILLIFACAQPLFYFMLLDLGEYSRITYFEEGGLFSKLNAMLLPLPLVKLLGLYDHYWPSPANFHINTILFFAFIVAMVGLLIHIAKDGFSSIDRAYLFMVLLAFIALLWSFGHAGGIWWILSYIPPFKYMNSPHKLMPFVHFFVVVTGVMFLSRLSASHTFLAKYSSLTACLIAALTLYNAYCCTESRFTFNSTPYPALPSPIERTLLHHDSMAAKRVLSIGKTRSNHPQFPLAMLNNYATHYKVISANGYDDGTMGSKGNRLVQSVASNMPEVFLREYGIGWAFLLHSTEQDFNYGTGDPILLPKNTHYPPAPNLVPFFDLLLSTDKFDFWKINVSKIKPLVYAETNDDIVSLPFSISPNGLIIDLLRQHGSEHPPLPVTVNFLHRIGFGAIDEHGKKLPVTIDDFERMQLEPGASSHTIFLTLKRPWAMGLGVAALLVAAALLIMRNIPCQRNTS